MPNLVITPKLTSIRIASTKPELAEALGVDPRFLTRILYIVKPENQYHQFTLQKKSGGERIINAPSNDLKSLQKKLSDLLLDCIDEINLIKFPDSQLFSPKLRYKKYKDHSAEVLKIKIPEDFFNLFSALLFFDIL